MSEENEKKMNPKDLVMFSTRTRKHIVANDINYLKSDYNIEVPDYKDPKYDAWNIPYIPPYNAVVTGFFSGLATGCGLNYIKSRTPFARIHVHIISGLLAGLTSWATYKYMDDVSYKRELVIWDYVKKHPEDFPEVFNKPKKYADLFFDWKKTI